MKTANSFGEDVNSNADEIQSKKRPGKVVLFRENRIKIPSAMQCVFHANIGHDTKLTANVVDLSRFGARVVFRPEDETVSTQRQFETAIIEIEGKKVFEGPAIVRNETPTADGHFSFGVVLGNAGVDIERVNAILSYHGDNQNLSVTKNILSILPQVKDEFKVAVADLNTVLLDLRQRLNTEEKRIADSNYSKECKLRMAEHAVSIALSLYTEDLNLIIRRLAEVTVDFDLDTERIHKRYFWTNFHPVTLGAGFINRGFTKPLGYAGDYGLMVMLYDYEDVGNSLFEKFFHRFSCNEPAALANRNRVDFLSSLIWEAYHRPEYKSEPFKVVSIACGPAEEIKNFVEMLDEKNFVRKIQIACVDQEPKALEHAQKSLRDLPMAHAGIDARFYQEDVVLGLIKSNEFREELGNAEVIVSAGLFDYLSDRVAKRLIELMFQLLRPGGILLVGNFSKDNPDRFSMDYFMDWKLVLRDEQDLLALVDNQITQDPKNKVDVITESLGLNLFLRIAKSK